MVQAVHKRHGSDPGMRFMLDVEMRYTPSNALRAAQVHSFIAEHRARLPELSELPPRAAGERQLCFVSLQGGASRVDLLQNDPFLRDPVTFLASDGFERDAALVAHRFPGATLASHDSDGSVWRLPPL